MPEEIKLRDDRKPFIVERMAELVVGTDEKSLIIFPEAAWPFVMAESDQQVLSDFIKKINRDTLIGAVEYVGGEFYNSAFLFDCNGKLQDKYQKIRIVPFGEYIPLRKLFAFIPVINEIGDMSRGKRQVVFPIRIKNFLYWFVLKMCLLILFLSFVKAEIF